MKYRILIKKEADLDLDEAIKWYEDRKKGLGVELYVRFEDVLNYIAEFPLAGTNIIAQYRKVLLRKFPYALY